MNCLRSLELNAPIQLRGNAGRGCSILQPSNSRLAVSMIHLTDRRIAIRPTELCRLLLLQPVEMSAFAVIRRTYRPACRQMQPLRQRS